MRTQKIVSIEISQKYQRIIGLSETGNLYIWSISSLQKVQDSQSQASILDPEDQQMTTLEEEALKELKLFEKSKMRSVYENLEDTKPIKTIQELVSYDQQIKEVQIIEDIDTLLIVQNERISFFKLSDILSDRLINAHQLQVQTVKTFSDKILYLKHHIFALETAKNTLSIFDCKTQRTHQIMSLNGNLKSLCKLYTDEQQCKLAVGTDESLVLVVGLVFESNSSWVIQALKHDYLPNHKSVISQIIYDQQTLSLFCAVDGLGVFKWLLFEEIQNLVKIFPTTRGFPIQKMLLQKSSNKLLISLGTNMILKYDIADGFNGYYESSNLQAIYDLIEIKINNSDALANQSMVIVSGKQNWSLDCEDEEEQNFIQDKEDTEKQIKSCVEVVNFQTNNMVLQLTNQ
eukprot:403334778